MSAENTPAVRNVARTAASAEAAPLMSDGDAPPPGAPSPGLPAPHAPATNLDAPDPAAYPRRWVALAVLTLGLSMIVLDGTIVGIALPELISALGLSLADATWVASLYSVVFAALLLTLGRLGDRFGRRRLFLIGVVVFVLSSLTAALAGDAAMLIASRAAQGVGGAAILPATLSITNTMFRGRERAAAFGVWGAVMAGMAAIGPLLGSWLTTAFDWRWIFLVNLPLGVLIVAGALAVVPESRSRLAVRGFDTGGLILSTLGFGLVVFGLVEGSSLGWWTPAADFSLGAFQWTTAAPVALPPVALGVGLAFLAALVVWEARRRHGQDAILDLTLFRLPTFSWGNLTALTVAVGEFALLFVLPLYLTAAQELTLVEAGWVLAAMALGAVFAGGSARHLAARFGSSGTVIVGLTLELAGAVAVALHVRDLGHPVVLALCLVVYGIGLGLASAQLTSTILVDVPVDRSGTGSALQSTSRQLGAAIGAAIAGSALAAGLAQSIPSALDGVAGLPGPAADGIATAAIDSVGGSITVLAGQGTAGQLGALGPEVVAALQAGFAEATSFAVWFAVACLLVGLMGAIAVARAARRSAGNSAGHSAGRSASPPRSGGISTSRSGGSTSPGMSETTSP